MQYIDDLEIHIRDSYTLIREYEQIRQDTDNPKERHRCKREADFQWELIESYLNDYINTCTNLGRDVPPDIRQIASHFPKYLAQEFQQAYATLQSAIPGDTDAFRTLTRILREFTRLHEHLNEWKELHNLLQECITSLLPLRGELESTIEYPGRWEKARGIRLWSPCQTLLRRLEAFASNIKYIDQPFNRENGVINGPVWMISISALEPDLKASLKEGNHEATYDLTLDLWDTCYDALYQADKYMRDLIKEIYILSNTILRNVDND